MKLVLQRRNFVIVIVLFVFGLSACVPAPVATAIPGMAQTLAVRTMVAQQGISYFATSTPTSTPLPIFLSNDLESHPAMYTQPPTSSPVPSLTPFKLGSSLLIGSDGCTNIAEFVRDVTVEDYAEFKPNQLFTKVWEVKNVGTCTWTTGYALVFTLGDRMSGMSPKALNKEVKPEETISLSIDLVAPKESDFYQGNWMLQDEHGDQFGTGPAAKDFFWVAITVGSSGLGSLFGFGGCKGGG